MIQYLPFSIPVYTLLVIYQVAPFNLYLAMSYLGDQGRVRQVLRVILLQPPVVVYLPVGINIWAHCPTHRDHQQE